MKVHPVRFSNSVTLDPVMRGGVFLGWGRIGVGAQSLRSGRRPMFVEIRNPAGIALREFVAVKQDVRASRVVIDFAMKSEPGGIMEFMVHTVRNRYNTADWTQPPRPARDTRLQLELRPIRRRLGGRDCSGFSYQYRYRSGSIPIYKMLDRGTWEPGGGATGNEFWMRNCFVPSIASFTSPRQCYSTEWFLPSCENPNIFQFVPLQTELQGFTFTTQAAGTLITLATEVRHIRSLFEKPRGSSEIVHYHEHCDDLSHTFTTAPVEVLWVPGGLDRVGRANLYEATSEFVQATLHRQIGMRRERITTFGQIEDWSPPDLTRFTRRGLPKLLRAGVRSVYVANHFQNNMNTWGVSNMCSTVDHQIADTVGAAKLRAFCRKANAAGARVQMWANTSISTLTVLFHNRNGTADRIRFLPRAGSIMETLAKARMPFVRNPSNAIESDHYAPQFNVLNLRDPVVCAYWRRRWRAAHDRIGLGGIFLDSSFNLSSDKFHFIQNTGANLAGATADQSHLLGHYRPATEPPAAILSQYRAHLDLMVAMQRMGYSYGNEDLGVFGTHRHGPSVEMRLDNLFLWANCIAGFDVPAIAKAGADPDDVFFRGLAYRLMWSLHWDIARDALCWNYGGLRGAFDRPTKRQLAWLRAFNTVADAMDVRTILPDEQGVLYTRRRGRTRVLWAFTDLTLPLGRPCRVTDAVTGRQQRTDRLAASRHHLYRIGAS